MCLRVKERERESERGRLKWVRAREAELNESVMVLKDQMMTGGLMVPPSFLHIFLSVVIDRNSHSLERCFNAAKVQCAVNVYHMLYVHCVLIILLYVT